MFKYNNKRISKTRKNIYINDKKLFLIYTRKIKAILVKKKSFIGNISTSDRQT